MYQDLFNDGIPFDFSTTITTTTTTTTTKSLIVTDIQKGLLSTTAVTEF